MSDLYEARNSIYCYENSNILKNQFNIKDNKLLEKAERKITLAKLYELRQNKKIGEFDIKHFVSIHKFLFEDIYPFAGLFRNENIAKGNFCFAEWIYIEDELKRILNELRDEKYLKDLPRDEFVRRLAYYMSELNVLHPFREGNGRTIREFIRELAYVNGYIFDLKYIEPEDMLNASIKSVFDTTDLEKILDKCLTKRRIRKFLICLFLQMCYNFCKRY